MEKENKLFTANYVFMIFTAIMAFSGNFMIISSTPRYCLEIGGSNSLAGIMTSLHMFAALASRPLWGRWADSIGRKTVFYSGVLLSMLATAGFFFSKTVGALLVARVVFGIGYSAITTANGTIVTDLIPRERLSEGLAFYGVASITAQAIAPPIALALYRDSFNSVLLFLTGIWLCCLLFAKLICYDEKALLKSHRTQEGRSASPGGVIEKTAVRASATITLMALAATAVSSFVVLLGADRGIENIGSFFTFSAAGLLVSRVLGASLPRKFGENRVFLVGSGFYIVSFFILSGTYLGAVACVAGVFYGLGMGFNFPILNAMAVRNAQPHRRGAATATFNLGQDAGAIVGGLLFGGLSDLLGFTAVYVAAAGIGIVMLALYFLLLGRSAQKPAAVGSHV